MKHFISSTLFFAVFLSVCSCNNRNSEDINIDTMYPWCIVAYDLLERSPEKRIKMMKEMGFSKYAYDWRDRHLDDMANELELANENGIEVISVWLWLNAKRDSLNNLSPSNERIFEILDKLQLKTTLWLSFSNNFFEDSTQEQSMQIAADMIQFVHEKADAIGCGIALYNHRGWFGNPDNQVELIKRLPQCNLSIVYNFHHAHQDLDRFPQIVKSIKPYLSSVNLNGMRKGGEKILPIGAGDHEKDMIKVLTDHGFDGPWGILAHVENEDAQKVLERNIAGFNSL